MGYGDYGTTTPFGSATMTDLVRANIGKSNQLATETQQQWGEILQNAQAWQQQKNAGQPPNQTPASMASASASPATPAAHSPQAAVAAGTAAASPGAGEVHHHYYYYGNGAPTPPGVMGGETTTPVPPAFSGTNHPPVADGFSTMTDPITGLTPTQLLEMQMLHAVMNNPANLQLAQEATPSEAQDPPLLTALKAVGHTLKGAVINPLVDTVRFATSGPAQFLLTAGAAGFLMSPAAAVAAPFLLAAGVGLGAVQGATFVGKLLNAETTSERLKAFEDLGGALTAFGGAWKLGPKALQASQHMARQLQKQGLLDDLGKLDNLDTGATGWHAVKENLRVARASANQAAMVATKGANWKAVASLDDNWVLREGRQLAQTGKVEGANQLARWRQGLSNWWNSGASTPTASS